MFPSTWLLATMALAAVAQQSPSLSSGCYWTTTVIVDGDFQSFTSMTPPTSASDSTSSGIIGTLESSASTPSDIIDPEPTIYSTSIGTNFGSMSTVVPSLPSIFPTSPGSVIASSVSAVTITESPAPSIEPFSRFVISVTVETTMRKRALTFYVAFNTTGSSILVGNIEDATLFILDQNGNLRTADDGLFVGTNGGSDVIALQKFYEPPLNQLRVEENGAVSLGPATFCAGTDGSFYAVYNADGAQECAAPASVAPEVILTTSSSASSTPEATKEATTSIDPEDGPSSSTVMTVPESSAFYISSSTTIPLFSSSNAQPSSSTSHNAASSSVRPPPSSSPTSQNVVSSSVRSPASSSTTGQNVISSSTTQTPSSTVSLSSPRSSTPSVASFSPSQTTTVTTITSTSILVASSTTPLLAASSSTTTTPVPSSSTTNPVSSSITSAQTTPQASSTLTDSSTSARTCVVGTRTIRIPPPKATRLPGKRGLAYDQVKTLGYYKVPTQVSWAYNYAYAPNLTRTNIGPFPPRPDLPLDYYPLLFNDKVNITNWINGAADSIEQYGSDVLFSFNEPDFCIGGSACMTVQQAIRAYELYMQPFAACGVRLSSPAVTNAGGGLIWLGQFMGNATQRGLTVDIINLHWYACAYCQDYFEGYFRNASIQFPGRKIWITEYGIGEEDRKDYYSENDVNQFIKNTTWWAEKQPYIEKIAWFGNYADKKDGRLLNVNGTGLNLLGNTWDKYVGTGYVQYSGFPGYGTSNRQGQADDADGQAEVVEEEDAQHYPNGVDEGIAGPAGVDVEMRRAFSRERLGW